MDSSDLAAAQEALRALVDAVDRGDLVAPAGVADQLRGALVALEQLQTVS